jgi:hypothetical protein
MKDKVNWNLVEKKQNNLELTSIEFVAETAIAQKNDRRSKIFQPQNLHETPQIC